MKYIFPLITLLLPLCTAFAQPKLSVKQDRKALGELTYQLPKTVTFTIKNEGNSPLIISEVHPSCGCLTVQFPTLPISPGEEETITAVYDAAMLGSFYRELAVYSNAGEQPQYLGFTGKVVEQAGEKSYEEDYPIDLGGVRMNTNTIEFDDVNKGDQPVAELRVANVGEEDFQPKLMHLPPYLKAEYLPATIHKGRVGRVRLTLDSEKMMMDGLNQTSIYMARYMGDRVSEKNEIVVSAVRLPSFQGLTASQLAQAPHMVLMNGEEMVQQQVTDSSSRITGTIFMPKVGRSKKLKKTLTLTNIGEMPLTIKAVQVFNRAVGVRLDDRVVPPHGSTKLRISLDTRQTTRGKAQPRILIISDDPRQAKVVLRVVQ